jgi:hypothetical protein
MKPTEFHHSQLQFKKTVSSFVKDAALATLMAMFGTNQGVDRQDLQAPVLVLKVEGRTGFGRLVPIAPDGADEALRTVTYVTFAIPVLADTFVDGNALSDTLTRAVADGAFKQRFEVNTNHTHTHTGQSWQFFSIPRWNSFEDTTLVSFVSAEYQIYGPAAVTKVTQNSYAHKQLGPETAKKLQVPEEWVVVSPDVFVDKSSGRASVYFMVKVPLDAHEATQELLGTLRNEFKLDIAGIGGSFTITKNTVHNEYGMVPADIGATARKVLIMGDASHPYHMAMDVPMGEGQGMLRGVQFPVDPLFAPDPPKFSLNLNVTRAVEVLIKPRRDMRPVLDLYGEPLPV